MLTKSLITTVFVLTTIAQGTIGKVLFVSLDGFRWDYVRKYSEYLPVLTKLVEESTVIKKGLTPVFPTLTFPNHWSMVTGLFPGEHGIIGNEFYDRNMDKNFTMLSNDTDLWGDSVPIWVQAEANNITTVVVHYPGCSVEGFEAFYNYPADINETPLYSMKYLVDLVFASFENESNPAEFGLLYIGEPDITAHKYGPDHKFTLQKLIDIDYGLKHLLDQLGSQDDLIVTGDHGMTQVDPMNLVDPSTLFSPGIVNVAILNGPALYVYANPGKEMLLKSEADEIKNTYPNVTWYDSDSVADEWHLSGNSQRFPDVLVMLPYHWYWATSSGGTPAGMHGWDTSYPDMHPIFIGHGKNFKKRFAHNGTVRSVDVYPLIAHLIGLNMSQLNLSSGISGSFDFVAPLLSNGNLLVWATDYLLQFPLYILLAIAILALICVTFLGYGMVQAVRTIREKTKLSSIYRGGYFLGDLESPSDDMDDEEISEFPRSVKNVQKKPVQRSKFSIGFGQPVICNRA